MCRHQKELIMLRDLVISESCDNLNYNKFLNSIWYKLARIMVDDSNNTLDATEIRISQSDQHKELIIEDQRLNPVLTYNSNGNDTCRFYERLGKTTNDKSKLSRCDAIQLMKELTLTDAERDYLDHGMMSGRQTFEKSFWYLFAYHIFREFGLDGILIDVPIDPESQDLLVIGKNRKDREIFRMPVTGRNAIQVVQLIKKLNKDISLPDVSLTPLKPKFRMFREESGRIIVNPFIELHNDTGDVVTYDLDKLPKMGGLFYIRDHNLLINVDKTNPNLPFPTSQCSIVDEDQLLQILSLGERGKQNDRIYFDTSLDDLTLYQRPDTLVITSAMYDKDWCWISLEYGVGNTSIDLQSFLEKRTDKNRYIKVENGWIDMESASIKAVRSILGDVIADQRMEKSGRLKLSRCELLLLHAACEAEIKVSGDDAESAWIRRFMALQPVETSSSIDGMTTPLRKYQLIGFNWLRFLYENGLGGLLCDDMGLGKTHQVMALIAYLVKNKRINEPVIVICPTTVMHHWFDKITAHTDLKAHVFHGNRRDLIACIDNHHIIITSYGILRNDFDSIKSVEFALAVFDEFQYLKNPETLSYIAANEMKSRVKIGLTGTPIENNLMELHSLFNIVLPGLLGSAHKFETSYLNSTSTLENNENRSRLKRFISPFTLRRLKTTVLQELPQKIEDVRTCFLSEDQIKLYRDTIAERGRGLKEIIQMDKEPIPYLHIFAVLNLLKQICDHPSLVNGHLTRYEEYSSGKWELFKELLAESLDSGQKVVVFTQYLGMIEIMERYLKMREIPFVTLTGSTRNRGDVVKRFNEDVDCRVFLGSLRAGGTGIDLVSGSVVIHYDRWWNAAREDQATDRIHRIGQTKVVQIFKLVTKGTLEEKISAIIERKRRMLSEFVQTDDPDMVKILSKEDLITILSDVKVMDQT